MTRVKPYDPQVHYWLLQTEPDQYGWDDLERDFSTVWNGVTDYEALKNLRDVDEGDMAFICHKGNEPAIVGIAPAMEDHELTRDVHAVALRVGLCLPALPRRMEIRRAQPAMRFADPDQSRVELHERSPDTVAGDGIVGNTICNRAASGPASRIRNGYPRVIAYRSPRTARRRYIDGSGSAENRETLRTGC